MTVTETDRSQATAVAAATSSPLSKTANPEIVRNPTLLCTAFLLLVCLLTFLKKCKFLDEHGLSPKAAQKPGATEGTEYPV